MPVNKVKDENEEYLKDAISIHIFGMAIRKKAQDLSAWHNVRKDNCLCELIKQGIEI